MDRQRSEIPKVYSILLLDLVEIFEAKVIPITVDSSAMAFIDDARRFPLRASIAIKAIVDVKTPGTRP